MTFSENDAVPTRFESSLEELFVEMKKFLVDKNRQYGSNNMTRYGHLGIIVRMSDKLARVESLTQSEKQSPEDWNALEDAYKDLLGYAAIGVLYMRGDYGG